jgi:hypothetical protein
LDVGYHARAGEDRVGAAQTIDDRGEVLETGPRTVVEAVVDGHDYCIAPAIEESFEPHRRTR